MQSRQRDVHFLKEEEPVSKDSSKVQDSFQERPHRLSVKRTTPSTGEMVANATKQIDGYTIARIWKWARQDINKNLKFRLSLERVTAKGIYSKHQEVFDKLAKIFNENNVSPLEYVKFFAVEWGGSEDKLDSELLDPRTIKAFETFQQALAKKKQIYTWFMKSVNNIAKECVQNGWFTTKDFMRHLINEKKLAGWYASGKISKYYLAAIPNFWKIVPKLDYFSKIELQQVAERYDMYHTEVNEAFLKLKNFKVNPIALTDAIIYEKRHGIKP